MPTLPMTKSAHATTLPVISPSLTRRLRQLAMMLREVHPRRPARPLQTAIALQHSQEHSQQLHEICRQSVVRSNENCLAFYSSMSLCQTHCLLLTHFCIFIPLH